MWLEASPFRNSERSGAEEGNDLCTWYRLVAKAVLSTIAALAAVGCVSDTARLAAFAGSEDPLLCLAVVGPQEVSLTVERLEVGILRVGIDGKKRARGC